MKGQQAQAAQRVTHCVTTLQSMTDTRTMVVPGDDVAYGHHSHLHFCRLRHVLMMKSPDDTFVNTYPKRCMTVLITVSQDSAYAPSVDSLNRSLLSSTSLEHVSTARIHLHFLFGLYDNLWANNRLFSCTDERNRTPKGA